MARAVNAAAVELGSDEVAHAKEIVPAAPRTVCRDEALGEGLHEDVVGGRLRGAEVNDLTENAGTRRRQHDALIELAGNELRELLSIIGGMSIFGLIAGVALLNHQNWARYVVLVVSALRLFRWPWGTLFGGYSIWVLTHQETKDLFNANS